MTSLEGADPSSLSGWYDLSDPENRQDRWVLHRLNLAIGSVNGYLNEYEFGEAQRTIYEFLWGDFCDWYIEMAKVRLRAGDTTPLKVLAHVLERTLRLLHPFMPFITEEIWQNLLHRLPRKDEPSTPSGQALPESIMIAPYPESDARRTDDQADQEMRTLILMIRAIRDARVQLGIPSREPLEAAVDADGLREAVQEESPAIRTLARVEPLRILDNAEERPPSNQSMTLVVDRYGSETPIVVMLPLASVVDISAERERLIRELQECEVSLERVQGLLANPDFSSKAPEEVVEREQERLGSLQERRERLREVLSQLPS
jgi:valyl-tRNA synthetase